VPLKLPHYMALFKRIINVLLLLLVVVVVVSSSIINNHGSVIIYSVTLLTLLSEHL